MYDLIKNFPRQLEKAITLGQQAQLTPAKHPLHHVVVAGMGGSGMSGALLRQWLAGQLPLPLVVNQDYTLPAYVNQHTLLILVSYSGNTEETLYALQDGLRRQAKIVCITAGGTLQALAAQHNLDHVSLPPGRPPRACLDHMVVQQLFVLYFHQLIAKDFVASLQDAIQLLDAAQTALQTDAQHIAQQLHGKLPVIYTPAPYKAVALRFRQ